MKDNFDVYDWKRGEYHSEDSTSTPLKEFDLHEWNKNRYLNETPENEYTVQFWVYRNDDYDDDYINIKANSEEEALAKAKEQKYKGKDFKIFKSNLTNKN